MRVGVWTRDELRVVAHWGNDTVGIGGEGGKGRGAGEERGEGTRAGRGEGRGEGRREKRGWSALGSPHRVK